MKILPVLFMSCLVFSPVSCKKEASPGKALLGDVTAPEDIKWVEQSHSNLKSYQSPSGEGWKKSGNGDDLKFVHKKDRVTILLKRQGGIGADLRDEYTDSYIDVNKRDAPKYAVTKKQAGSLSGSVGMRVDGTFDNGTAYTTRDYLVFRGGAVVMMMARAPTKNSAKLHAIVDYMASSISK